MKQKHYFVIEYEIDMDFPPNNSRGWDWPTLSRQLDPSIGTSIGWAYNGLKLAAVEVDGDYKLLYKRD